MGTLLSNNNGNVQSIGETINNPYYGSDNILDNVAKGLKSNPKETERITVVENVYYEPWSEMCIKIWKNALM